MQECVPPTKEEVVCMIEQSLIAIIYILFYTLIGITIITVALIIAISSNYKQKKINENTHSAGR